MTFQEALNPAVRRLLTLIMLLFCSYIIQAQRLNTGLSFDIYGFHPTRFPTDIIFSETNYKAYYIKQYQAPRALTMNISANLVVDYSRFFLSLKYGIASTPNGIVYKYSYPVSGDKFTDYYSEISYQMTDLSGSIGYYVNRQRLLKTYLEAGLGRSSAYFYSENMSTDPDFGSQWTDRHEITDYLQLDKSFTYILTGIGFRMDIMAISARYKIRVGDFNTYYSSLSFGLTVYTKFSKLRKHYIYQPEE
jgi:hypothetical protein